MEKLLKAGLMGIMLLLSNLVSNHALGAQEVFSKCQNDLLKGSKNPQNCANMKGFDFRVLGKDHPLVGVNMSSAHLNGAVMSGMDLSGASLKRADLRGAFLNGANLIKADFSGAKLNGANLNGASFDLAKFENAIFNDQTVLPFSHYDAIHKYHMIDATTLNDVVPFDYSEYQIARHSIDNPIAVDNPAPPEQQPQVFNGPEARVVAKTDNTTIGDDNPLARHPVPGHGPAK